MELGTRSAPPGAGKNYLVTLQELDEELVVLDEGHLHAVERHERLGKNLRGVLLRDPCSRHLRACR